MSVVLEMLPVLPVVVVVVLAAALLSGPLGRWLPAARWLVWLLISAFGAVLAVTLTPVAGPGPWAWRTGVPGQPVCDLASFAVPGLHQLLLLDQTSLNVALLVPLGVACALLPRRSQVVVAAAFGALLPSAVETAQGVVTSLHRVCSGADLADNLTGFAVGLVVGLVLRPLIPVERRLPGGAPAAGQPAAGAGSSLGDVSDAEHPNLVGTGLRR